MKSSGTSYQTIPPRKILLSIAYSWGLSTVLVWSLSYFFFLEYHKYLMLQKVMLYTGLSVSVLFLLLSTIGNHINLKLPSAENNRVITTFLWASFAAFPMVFLFFMLGSLYYLFVSVSSNTDYIFRCAVLTIMLVGVGYQFYGYRKRFIEKRFIEKEFFIDDDKILFNRRVKTNLDAPDNANSKWGRLYNKHGQYLFYLIPFAYPLQRVFTHAGGSAGSLILLTLLATPLCMWMLLKISCIGYVYIYTVLKLERKYEKPVVFV